MIEISREREGGLVRISETLFSLFCFYFVKFLFVEWRRYCHGGGSVKVEGNFFPEALLFFPIGSNSG